MTAPPDPRRAPPDPAGRTARPDPWRAEVGRLRARERRRRFPMGVQVGAPGLHRASVTVPWPALADHDAGLRLDVVSALLDALLAGGARGNGAGQRDGGGTVADPAPALAASAWLTRPGEPVLHDRDLEWYAAAVHGFAACGMRLLEFRAVTRTGWLDVVTGEQRVWRRLRL